MTESDIKLLLLVPVGLALVFMLWVLWKLEMQIRRGKRHPEPVVPAAAKPDLPASNSSARAARSSDTAAGPHSLRIGRN